MEQLGIEARPDEPPCAPVRARRPLTAQSLVERAEVAPRTPEAETVLRIFRRQRDEHAALYVAETRDLASLGPKRTRGTRRHFTRWPPRLACG